MSVHALSLYSSAFFLLMARDGLMGKTITQDGCCKAPRSRAWCWAGYVWAQMLSSHHPAPKCLSVRGRICLCIVSREALQGIPGTHGSVILFLPKRHTRTQTLCTYIHTLALCGEDLTAANTALRVCRRWAAEDHLRWSELEGIGMVDQWETLWPPHVLARCLLPTSLQAQRKQKFAFQVAI